MTTYPGTLDSFTTKTNDVDYVDAAHVNDLQAAVVAIETELGTDPAGTVTDLKTRLAKSLSGAGVLDFADSTVLTINSGEITVTQNFHRVATEGGAGTDNLDTISGATGDGHVLIIRPSSASYYITVRHDVNNILCTGSANFTLFGQNDFALLIYDSNLTAWLAHRGTAGNSMVGNGTSGQVALFSGTSTLISDSGLAFDTTTGILSVVDTVEVSSTAATGSDVTTVLTLTNNTSDTPADGRGVAIVLEGETSTTDDQQIGKISAIWDTATHGSRIGNIQIEVDNSSGAVQVANFRPGNVVINEGGADVDFRVESDTNANILVVDANNDAVYLGSAAGAWVEAQGTNGVIVNQAGAAAIDFRVEGDTVTHALFVDASADAVLMGGTGAGDWVSVNGSAGVVINEAGAAAVDLRVEGDTETNMIFNDASADTLYLGGTTNGVKIAKGGEFSLIGTATQWDDLRVPIYTRTGGTTPGYAQFKTNGAGSTGVYLYWFDKASVEELFFEAQMPHGWKTESTIYPHVHFVPKTTGGAGLFVRWGIEYTVATIGGTYGNTTIIYSDASSAATATTSGDAALTADKHYVSVVGASGISMTGMGISAVLVGRIFRDAGAATDDYDDDAGLLAFDIHYEMDSLGSTSEFTK